MISYFHIIMGKSKSSKKSKSKASKVEVEQPVEDQEIDQTVTKDNLHLEEEDDESVQETSDKKTKKDFSEELDSLLELRNEESEVEKQIREKNEELRLLYGKLKKNKREQNSVINRLGSLHKSELKAVSKEKRKRSEDVKSGIQKEKPVPETLINYLGLEEGAMLPRTKVVKLMHKKWKEAGLKNGQTTTLNKKHAKDLGYPNGYVIEFKDYQPFVSSFYNSNKAVDV